MILIALVLARHLFYFLTLLNSAQELASQPHWEAAEDRKLCKVCPDDET